jgi:hypothetical protein
MDEHMELLLAEKEIELHSDLFPLNDDHWGLAVAVGLFTWSELFLGTMDASFAAGTL